MNARAGNNPLLAIGIAVLTALILAFITLPIAALVLRISPSSFLQAFADPVVRDALALSLLTASITTIVVILCGTPLAYLNARYAYPGKAVIETLVDLPLVLPPAVAGLALLMAFGRRGIIGQYLEPFGITIPFTTFAVILAQVFVAAPLYLRQARTSFSEVDRTLENAARTLGASPLRTFFRITIPLAAGGIVSGGIMAWARALGEFGATIMFAGNLQGVTQTMPLAIYTTLQADLDASLALAIIIVVISFGIIIGIKVMGRRKLLHDGN